jgi:hypothetical protein
MATVFPGMSGVELLLVGDESVKNTKHSTNLTVFSLESKLHGIQFFEFVTEDQSSLEWK